MEIPKSFKTEDLYLLVERTNVKFGEINKQNVFIALDRMSYARPNHIDAASAGNEFDSIAYSLKTLCGSKGSSVLSFDFSLTENEVLKKLYEKGEVDFITLKKIEAHLEASIVGRKSHTRANVALKRDLFELGMVEESEA